MSGHHGDVGVIGMSSRWLARAAGRGAPAVTSAPLDRAAFPAGGRPDPGPGDGAAAVPLVTIDALGRKCPIPIIMLAERIREVPIGQVIAVLADDPAAESDVPAWCLMKSHDHVLTQPLDRGWSILIRRGY